MKVDFLLFGQATVKWLGQDLQALAANTKYRIYIYVSINEL